MSDTVRHHRRCVVVVNRVVVVTVALFALSGAAAAATTEQTVPVESAPATTEPDAADTTPAPEATTGPTSGLIGADPDPDAGDVAVIAVVGLLVVLGFRRVVDGATRRRATGVRSAATHERADLERAR